MQSGARILVVEDSQPTMVLVRDILEAQSYAVDTALNGIQALQAMEHACPDLIVADIMMPEMDGYALYERVRACPQWTAIPFIFLTAKGEKSEVLKGKAMGAEDYITKPFTLDEVRVAVQSRLERAQALQRATEAEFERQRQEFTLAFSRGLRAPLERIQACSGLEQADIAALSPEALYEHLSGMKTGIHQLHGLVDDLELLVRLDNGQARQEYEKGAQIHDDLGALITTVLAQYRQAAADKGLDLKYSPAPDPSLVKLHGPFIVDALGRLVDNAIKFSAGEGERVSVSAGVANGWTEIAVTDQGKAIPSEDLPRLFGRFQQLNRDGAEPRGCGLGLAIAHGLVRLHGGEILVQSAPGQGSVFTLRLPPAKKDQRDLDREAARKLFEATPDILMAYTAILLEASPSVARQLGEAGLCAYRIDMTLLLNGLAEALMQSRPAVFAELRFQMNEPLTTRLGSPLAVELSWLLLKDAIGRYIPEPYLKRIMRTFDRAGSGAYARRT